MLEGVAEIRSALSSANVELERLQLVLEGVGDSGAPPPVDVLKAQDLRKLAQSLTSDAGAAAREHPGEAELVALDIECAELEAKVEATAIQFEVGWDI